MRNPKTIWLTLLVFAGILNVKLLLFGILEFAFLNDPKDTYFFHKLLWMTPLCGFPLFMLVFLSRKLLAFASWIIWIISYVAVIASSFVDCPPAECSGSNILIHARSGAS